MKKLISLFLVAIILVSATSPCFAASNDITVYVNTRKLKLEVSPIVINDRTLVPVRAIFEALGAEVEWREATQQVYARKGNNEILLTIGSNQTMVNGKQVFLDVPAQIINDRTMIPVRFVSENFGAKVTWVEANRTIYIVKTTHS